MGNRFSREGSWECIFRGLRGSQGQYTIYLMAIPHRCPQCFENVTLIQPQHKGGAFKGPAKSQCLNCMYEREYDLTVPVNREDNK
jgi:hypothetical protein